MSETGRTILLVEDEALIRMVIVEVLEDEGYAVIEAADGRAALAIVQSDRQIDLLITDVNLPGIDGRALATAAWTDRPTLKVLFMTGAGATRANGPLEATLGKPFAMEVLASTVAELMAT